MNDFQTMEEKCAENYQCNSWIVKELGKITLWEAEKELLFSSIYLQKSYKMWAFRVLKVKSRFPGAFFLLMKEKTEVVFTILSLKNNIILKYHIRSSLEKLDFRKVFLLQYITNISQNNCLQKKEKFFLLMSRST